MTATYAATSGPRAHNETLSIQFNKKTGRFDVKAAITQGDVVDPAAGEITTSVAIGTHAFTSTNTGRSVSKGNKLVTP